MQKLTKRVISSVLASVLLLGAVACGSSGETCETTTTSDATTEAVTTEAAYSMPKVDYGGRTVTIAATNYHDGKQILEYHPLLIEETGDIINDAIVNRNRKIEENFNVTLELFPLDVNDRYNSSKLQQQILAGDDTIQFAMPMAASIGALLSTEGMLVDLQAVPNLDLSNSWWNQNCNEEFNLYGKQYVAVGDISFFNLGAPLVFYFSKKLVED